MAFRDSPGFLQTISASCHKGKHDVKQFWRILPYGKGKFSTDYYIYCRYRTVKKIIAASLLKE